MKNKSIARAGIFIGMVVALGLITLVNSIPVKAEGAFQNDVPVLTSSTYSGRDYLGARDLTVSSPGTGQSLLSPGWGLRKQEAAVRLLQPVGLGVDLDAGIYAYSAGPLPGSGHKEYFQGLSCRAFDGGVWYTNDELRDERVARVEAGWTHDTGSDLLFSVRMGRTDYGSSPERTDSTNLSLGAQKRTGRLGFGLRLVDQRLLDTPQARRLHLFGTLTADFE